jgi:HAD superfamily hydrolase (TIGR01509 family)
MNKIRTILFDMDGVLIDAREWHYEALNQVLSIFGYEITREMHESRYDGLSTAKKLNMLSEELGLPIHLHQMINRVKQDRTLRIAAQRCYPSAAHQVLISTLKEKNFKVGVVTNSIRQTAEFMLTYAGLIDLIDILITNQDVKEPKPSPEGYLKAMNFLGMAPEECLIVEDSVYGIQAANSSGARVIKVNSVNEVNLDALAKVISGLV